MKIQINSPLITERLGNRLWVLSKAFSVCIAGKILTVPKGFVTDGASCPRCLWWLCSPIAGPFGEAAVVHDFLYSIEGPDVLREIADELLYWFGVYRGASCFRAWLVKKGVNFFGSSSFKNGVSKVTVGKCYNYFIAVRTVEVLKKGV